LNSGSNSPLAANRVVFNARFPELASILGLDSDTRTEALLAAVPEAYRLETSRSGHPTLSANGLFVHSRYDPLRDAERAVADEARYSSSGCLFAGCGLAWLPELYARKFPQATIVLVEPDIFLFLLCLASRPLANLLNHPSLVLLVGTPPREVLSLLERMDLQDLSVDDNPALTAANRPWFDEFAVLRKRTREKKEINANTLRRFGDLWLKNMSRNLHEMRDRPGIGSLGGRFSGMPVLVIAAGPSLDRMLPRLKEIRKHAVIIAVDTAVRACVRSGVEPDFIILVDPQYWNWRHLDGLECPSSILITESAAWPAVFRFRCREIYLCASLFPLGKFLESRTGERTQLGAGGSVSTTAWDFARHLGPSLICMAALDLGFPEKKTHFTGSIFEERAHTASHRLAPAETAGYLALYGAGPYPVPDYRGGTVLTDKRLILYAWWFESRLAGSGGPPTSTLTPEGVHIPGFTVGSVEELLSGPEIRDRIDLLLEDVVRGAKSGNFDATGKKRAAFDRALAELAEELLAMAHLADRGIALCSRNPKNPANGGYTELLGELDRLDADILASPAKEVASMVFSAAAGEKSGKTDVLEATADLYRNILAAVAKNISALTKFY